MRIQPAAPNNIAEILRIVQANSGAPQWTEAQVRKLFDQDSATVRRNVLIATLGSGVAGFAVISVVTGADPQDAELESIAVDPGKQRQGIGRALLCQALKLALQHGASCLRLEVRESNAAALRLYAGCAFARAGVRRGYYSHPVEDAVLMERSLG